MIEFLKRLFFYPLSAFEDFTGKFYRKCSYSDVFKNISIEVNRTSIFMICVSILAGMIAIALYSLYNIIFFMIKSPEEISEYWGELFEDISFIFTGKKS